MSSTPHEQGILPSNSRQMWSPNSSLTDRSWFKKCAVGTDSENQDAKLEASCGSVP